MYSQAISLQTCTFRVDYTLENIPGREFGSVFVGASSENVALRVVADGWAKVALLFLNCIRTLKSMIQRTLKGRAQKIAQVCKSNRHRLRFLSSAFLNKSIGSQRCVMHQVREGKKAGAQSPYMEQLLAATKAAETQKKGIWSQVSFCI